MDAIFSQSSEYKSQSPRKHLPIINQNKNNHSSHAHHGILRQAPLSLSSYPPLLPLPTPNPNRCFSTPPINRKNNNRSVNKTIVKKNIKLQNIKPNIKHDNLVDISGPDPSSLPLPMFFLRSKSGCKAEAGEVDAGATDGIRQLLGIR